ncbi:hypothetical protein GALMADRAFT_141745 [Galerina marginata CBS 339.88]|uniref:Protein kinase domain-containing protein n=1 Tax=Galerina marginata (strain CBS 339.88) TaxID=685588 RepID=A0A067T259_GALM3|nr:hypothetical protein GALMADRAFT_141745 [Galerina marginata CBS 339.88]
MASASTSLQIPTIDSPPRPHHRPTSVAAPMHNGTAAPAAAPPTASAASRRQRASHTVVSPTQQQQLYQQQQQQQQQQHYPGQHQHQHQHQSHQQPQSSHHQRTDSNPTSGAAGNSGSSGQPPLADVYAHSAAVAYAAAHPRRTIPKFGPYLLLQTLGEGEFGKVKLGLHSQWGEEVAVKLIRRGNVDSSVRMSKVEREIEVLKTLKHPNIVRLYDVIETDKYIGIILEYASGGELFDHILAHRYLREKDAAKLFSQLISGVWYIHQKKIVHRDLKLENLLLDKHRNVIITDFGFANRFEHKTDDLMQTSCGSPCYAAPELVISEGLYVGSAVDIWSCGVILYAMLAGYLPFDDDPANPDGDNINLLYKYIVSTPLSFPEYISQEARDLLGMMLVPDPTRRTSLEGVMRHPWLAGYSGVGAAGVGAKDGQPTAFGKTVDELERAAMEQHRMKRVAYQKQMMGSSPGQGQGEFHSYSQAQSHAHAHAQAHTHSHTQGPGPFPGQAQAQAQTQAGSVISTSNTIIAPSPSRTQSHIPGYSGHGAPPTPRSRSTQPEYLYDSSVDQSLMTPGGTPGSGPNTPTQVNGGGAGSKAKQYGSPAALGLSEDDPFAFAGSPSAGATTNGGLSPVPPPSSATASGPTSGNATATVSWFLFQSLICFQARTYKM